MRKPLSSIILASLLLATLIPTVVSSPWAGTRSLAVVASTTTRKDFSFGPGTAQDHSHERTLSVPPKTTVSVAVELSTDGGAQVPVYIEVHQASATSFEATGPDGPLLDTKAAVAPQSLVTFTPSYVSDFGCPNTWRVRVTTQSGQRPPVKVFGTIIFVANTPAASNLGMEDAFDLNPNGSVTRSLSNITSHSTGVINVKAKWHTDPLDVLVFGQFFKVRVALLKPDGSVANSLEGFSLHATADKTPKLNFSYNVTAQDASLAGNWKIRVTNISSHKIVGFLIEKGIDPNPAVPDFHSTFTPRCF